MHPDTLLLKRIKLNGFEILFNTEFCYLCPVNVTGSEKHLRFVQFTKRSYFKCEQNKNKVDRKRNWPQRKINGWFLWITYENGFSLYLWSRYMVPASSHTYYVINVNIYISIVGTVQNQSAHCKWSKVEIVRAPTLQSTKNATFNHIESIAMFYCLIWILRLD